MSKLLYKFTAHDAVPLGIYTLIDRGHGNWISCTTKFIQNGSHFVGESIFRVYIDAQLICRTPYLDVAIKVFENPNDVTE